MADIKTKKDYEEYKQRVAAFMQRENINCLSFNSDREPYFSWRPCECCGDTLGGNRYDVAGYNNADKEIYLYAVCPDCLCYTEYGQLDDMTMMDMEE